MDEIGPKDSGREAGGAPGTIKDTVESSETARGAPGVTKGPAETSEAAGGVPGVANVPVETSGDMLRFSGVSGTYPLQYIFLPKHFFQWIVSIKSKQVLFSRFVMVTVPFRPMDISSFLFSGSPDKIRNSTISP